MRRRLPKIEDSLNLERFTGGDYCEERDLLAYASTAGKGIVLKNLSDGSKTAVYAGGKEGAPQFSPDGKELLFLAGAPGLGRQVFVKNLDDESLRQITEVSGSCMEPLWSPDGRKILFAVRKTGAQILRKWPDEAIVIEEPGYKQDGVGFLSPESHVQLWIAFPDGTVRQITEGPYDYLHANWSPDGNKICCVSNRFRPAGESLGFDLLVLDADKEPGKLLFRSEGYVLVSYPNPIRPVFAPDGGSVIAGVLNPAQLNDASSTGYPEACLYEFPVDGREEKQPWPLFEPDENCYQCVQFPYNAGCGWGMEKLSITEDGKKIYFHSGYQGQCRLYCLKRDGKKSHPAVPVAGGKMVYNGMSSVRNGKLLLSCAGPLEGESYRLFDTETEQVTRVCESAGGDLLNQLELSAGDDFFTETLDGESRIHVWVIPPIGIESGKKYPAILYVHGGPHPFYTYSLTMEHQCMAARGYGVILCNPRGSSGYGWKHQNFQRAMDGSAYIDCLQAVDETARRFAWIDRDRLGVTGGSYGGYMTNYMAAHCERFRAYVTQRSISNQLIAYASSDMAGSSKRFTHFEEFMMDQLKESPVAFAERIHRPLLILHGTEDYRTPVEGAHQLFIAVKDLHPDLPVRMVLFPHTAHEQPTDPGLLKRYFDEMMGWFDRWLKELPETEPAASVHK